MSELMRTKKDALFCLMEDRNSIRYNAQMASDLGNTAGAEMLSLAAERLTEIIRQNMHDIQI